MLNKRIIYQTEEGLKIIIPTEEYLNNHSIEDLAKKDVPQGFTYYIVDLSEIPTDRTFRGAWIWE
jgi:hypothetical protein